MAPAFAAETSCAPQATPAGRPDATEATGATPSADRPRMVQLEDDGSLRLSDGRRLVPMQVVLPVRFGADAPLWAGARAAVSNLAGVPLRLGATSTDRHGRLIGAAWLDDTSAGQNENGSTGESLALALVRAGAAYADPTPACTDSLLAAEDAARRTARGLWQAAGARPGTTDIEGLSARAGLFSVAEGRILTVGVRRDRTYLNFGDSWRQDFTVMMATADFATIFGHGLDPAMLRGTMVRVRGVVREQGGPAMVVKTAAAVTRLVDDDAERSADRRGKRQ